MHLTVNTKWIFSIRQRFRVSVVYSFQSKINEYICKIWGFHGGDYKQCHLLGCYTVWLLKRRFLQQPHSETPQKRAFLMKIYIVWKKAITCEILIINSVSNYYISGEKWDFILWYIWRAVFERLANYVWEGGKEWFPNGNGLYQTNSIDLSPSWEATSHSATQELLNILRNLKFH
jgi:hypothetical protein